MGKIAKLLLPFLLVVFAFGGGIFDEFDNKFAKAKKQDQIQIYHELKGIYLNSILNDNKKLQLESLKRLVSGAKTLGVDYSVYAKELDTISPKIDKNELKPKSANKEDNKQAKTKNQTNNSKESQKTNSKNQKNIEYKVLSASSTQSKFTITLNADATNLNIKKSELNTNKSYRQIFDFDGILIKEYKKQKSQISNQIRVAQFDKDSIRVVFTNNTKQNISYKIDGKSIIFSLNGANSKDNNIQKTTTNTSKKINSNQKNQSTSKANRPTQTQSKATNIGKNKVIVLDAGHGGKDPGAVGKNKLYEKDIVLHIALEAGNILKKRGYKVYYTRSNDKFINLRNRTSFANDKNADIFISIHANASPNNKKAKEMQGIETYFLSPTRSERSMQVANLENKADTDEMNYFTKISYLNFLNREKIIASNKLAIDVQANLLGAVKSKFKVVDGGVREAPFWVLVGAQMPAVLIETGYISNDNDHKLLSNKGYRNKIALGIANGIDDYFVKNR